MTIAQMNRMTLTEAKALLDSIGYRENWTTPELLAACDKLPRDVVAQLPLALEITATAYVTEAQALEAEASRLQSGEK